MVIAHSHGFIGLFSTLQRMQDRTAWCRLVHGRQWCWKRVSYMQSCFKVVLFSRGPSMPLNTIHNKPFSIFVNMHCVLFSACQMLISATIRPQLWTYEHNSLFQVLKFQLFKVVHKFINRIHSLISLFPKLTRAEDDAWICEVSH